MQRLSSRLREVVAYKNRTTGGLFREEVINRQAQKVAAVAYWRWSFTRGSNCKALTGKSLMFWTGGRLWEVVAKRWSHMEFRL